MVIKVEDKIERNVEKSSTLSESELWLSPEDCC